MENTTEKRYVVSMRANEGSRLIEGTAIVFNSQSEDMGFREVIAPEAIDQALLDSSDIVFLINHNDDMIPIARSKRGKGSLKLRLNQTGVDFAFNVRKTAIGDEVLGAIQDGSLDACSFAFAVAEGGEKWEKLSDGNYLRTITKIGLLRDMSIVNFPAYSATVVNTRGLEELKEKESREVVVTVVVTPEEKPEEKPEPEMLETDAVGDPEPAPETGTTENDDRVLAEYFSQYDAIIESLKK